MYVHTKDEVAVMPRDARSAADVLKIARVQHVGHICVQTSDGGMYAAADGEEISGHPRYYIEPATNEHRTALLHRHH